MKINFAATADVCSREKHSLRKSGCAPRHTIRTHAQALPEAYIFWEEYRHQHQHATWGGGRFALSFLDGPRYKHALLRFSAPEVLQEAWHHIARGLGGDEGAMIR
eukprot:4125278-Amphidinium_carterae.1